MVATPIDFGASRYSAIYTFRILTLKLMSLTIVAGSVAAFGNPPAETRISQCVSQKEKVD